MDDPWGNAWADPASHSLKTLKEPENISAASTSSWTEHTHDDHNEADIAMPSWSTGAEIQWNEPSNHANLWSQPGDTQKVWEPSPYEHLPLGKASVAIPSPRSPEPEPEREQTSPISASETSPLPSPHQAAIVQPHPSPPPDSPDVFGSFETGLYQETSFDQPRVKPWASSVTAITDAEAWGRSAWAGSEVATEADITPAQIGIVEPRDEWEIARDQKEKQDSTVPPELLASIIRQFEDLSVELWPSSPGAQSDHADADWMNNWRSGMDNVEDLAVLINRFIPPEDMTLPAAIQLGRSFIAKNMAEAIRLTRHLPSSKMSPMAHFLSAKGSTAWEAEVKTRPELSQDEIILPAGWRVVDKDKEHLSTATADVGKGKKAGVGLLSFWGRKPSALAPSDAEKKGESSSPAQPSLIPANVPRFPEPSIDSAKPPLGLKDASSVASLSSASLASSTSSATATASYADAPDPITESFTPAPSAVSRFLGRFSRLKAGASSRNSMALSSHDLEFLSDIAPSAADDVQDADGDPQLNELSSVIDSNFALPKKLSPPLPPPPVMTSSSASGGVLGKTPSDLDGFLDFEGPSVEAAQSNKGMEDLSSLFSAYISNEQQQPAAIAKSSVGPSQPSNFTAPLTLPVNSSPSVVLPSIPPSQEPFMKPVSFSPPPTIGHIRTLSQTLTSSDASSPSAFALPLSSQSQTPTSNPTPRIVSPVDKILSQFIIPPPPTSRSQSPATIAAPPNRSSLQGAFSTVSQPTPPPTVISSSSLLDDDDFSEFHSPPAQSSSCNDFSFSFSDHVPLQSGTNPLPKTLPKQTFDDLDGFTPPPIRSASPPQPPTKSSPKPTLSTITPSPPQHRRKAPRADHIRTKSLVDNAAARPGRWPAPPSPLPQAIPPPYRTSNNPSDSDFLSDNTPWQQPGTLSNSNSSPAIMHSNSSGVGNNLRRPSPPSFVLPSPPPSFQDSIAMNLPSRPAVSPPMTSASSSTGKGGLSAQDLSFFEGL